MKKLLTLLTVCAVLTSCSSAGTKPDTNTPSLPDTPPAESNITEDTPDPTEKKEDIVLTFGTVYGVNSDIQHYIDEFNNSNCGYKIQVKQYASLFDENNDYIERSTEEAKYIDLGLLQDIMNTDEIDIVSGVSFANPSYYKILESKGAFVDLYEFMKNDSEVNKNTLNSHVLNLMETNGKLCSISPFYNITTLKGETKYVGDKENWTFDEFLEHWNNMPDNSTIDCSQQKENIYYVILRSNLESFIDYENAEVHFNSEDFRKILEFCNTFESNNGEKGEYDYDAPVFVNQFYIDRIMSMAGFTNNADTLVGFPSDNESGAFIQSTGFSLSISAKSSPEKQQGAWEFIRKFETEKWQTENVIPYMEEFSAYSSEHGLCINNNAFENIAQNLIDKKYYEPTYESKGVEYERPFPTRKDVDKLVEYINSIKRSEVVMDRSLWEIVNEEIMYYFAGEKTLDECVDLIQNRASIWISEQS